MTEKQILIRGARQHNLKNIDLSIPRDRLVVITGLSGSGKSSLAFDTLYAEGQRRYVESLSTYARQFLERMEKPQVDLIDGLAPAIAIEQKTAAHNPRSTVGTVTEIHDYLRLLFARVGTAHCTRCGRPITAQTHTEMLERILALPEGSRIVLLAPVSIRPGQSRKQAVARLRKDGFARIRLGTAIIDVEDGEALAAAPAAAPLEVVVDRVVVKPEARNRLADSLDMALSISDGRLRVRLSEQEEYAFSEKAVCENCGIGYPPFSPASFSFNSPHGACPRCDGLGTTMAFDENLLVLNPTLSLREGAVEVWADRRSVPFMEFLEAFTARYGTNIYTPYRDLPEDLKTALMHGSPVPIVFRREQNGRVQLEERTFEGLIPQLRQRYEQTESARTREDLRRFMTHRVCPECQGSRLNPASRAVRVAGHRIGDITALPIHEAIGVLDRLGLTGQDAAVADRIVREIRDRLRFLSDVGLGYLTLERSAATLSGGESQRIRLATQIGAKLTGVLYVLDEPSIGLHPRDNRRLLETLMRMRDLGNTVLVVEHDEETIRAADYVVDMGPGAGVNGGHVVFSGPPEGLVTDPATLTGQYHTGRRSIPCPSRRPPGNGFSLNLHGASQNNLKSIDVTFPLGCFIVVTGVSGSGKSTLVLETLYAGLNQHLHQSRIRAGAHTGITGLEHVDKVIHIDQSPIGKSPRSNPGTYTGLFAPIRDLLAHTPEARARGYKAGRFSFNVKGGRCESCQGDGILKIEMHFLPDVFVTCDTCGGKRYNRETLEIRYKGKTIAEILDMTINQALAFFRNQPLLRDKLETLVEVGLGYIHIGQSATTLSGGEAQRVKLARELSKRSTGRTVYILDEPTTGLHAEDIRRLLEVLNRLVDTGNTIITIEHNLDVIKSADYLIDLGPEGGNAGGTVVGTGTPEQIAALPGSYTGRFLKPVLARRADPKRAAGDRISP